MPDPLMTHRPDILTVLGMAFEGAPNAIFVAEEDGTILFANEAAALTFHYAPDELIGQPASRLFYSLAVAAADRAAGPSRHLTPALEAMAGHTVDGLRSDGVIVPLEVGVKRTSDGARPLLIISIADVSERVNLEARLTAATNAHLGFQRLVTDIASRFVKIEPDKVDATINESLRQIGEALQLDRAMLWCKPHGESTASATHVWQTPRAPEPPSTFSVAVAPWMMARLNAGEPVWFAKPDDVPDPIDRDTFRDRGLLAKIVVPLPPIDDERGTIRGVSFSSFTSERDWPPTVIERLRLLATVIGQALARKIGQAALEKAIDEVRQLRDRLTTENVELRREVKGLRTSRPIVADSPAIQLVLAQVQQVAPTPATVLLLGETGTGKEVMAQAIHDLSPRHLRPMVRVSCAAIPPARIESELFGREKGAYTGALSRQIGRFEAASQSTLFLDEIGELPLEVQVKLLRVLQDRTIERLGSTQSIKINVRIIAATNRNLEEAVQNKTFREDLFYRLNVFPITVPPLRERPEDVTALVWSFVDEFSSLFGKKIESISKESLRELQRYPWPGNVRELRNVIERAVIVSDGRVLTMSAPKIGERNVPQTAMTLTALEIDHIRAVLEATNWRIRGAGGAAERLGLKPTTLESRMARLGILRKKPV
jgi:formate hydrogenlyase transcriptional activator